MRGRVFRVFAEHGLAALSTPTAKTYFAKSMLIVKIFIMNAPSLFSRSNTTVTLARRCRESPSHYP
uniref:Uncharacterized protein n=1 Tax=Candidatus Nitrotoga fabula TaxID=2182327 RepID=A0A2X0RE95_9PROT|nr:protein of unknown function [Candidatus Nitrotoga fabula]